MRLVRALIFLARKLGTKPSALNHTICSIAPASSSQASWRNGRLASFNLKTLHEAPLSKFNRRVSPPEPQPRNEPGSNLRLMPDPADTFPGAGSIIQLLNQCLETTSGGQLIGKLK